VTVRFYVLSSRWDDEPIRLFQTRGEAEDALRLVGEDTLGLAADAFVMEAEFDFEAAEAGESRVSPAKTKAQAAVAHLAGASRPSAAAATSRSR
jgi:uncharacterized protein YbjT (DUF2867 family)